MDGQRNRWGRVLGLAWNGSRVVWIVPCQYGRVQSPFWNSSGVSMEGFKVGLEEFKVRMDGSG